MSVPFTVEQFFDLFEAYNTAIWPAQVVAYVLGLAAVALAARGGNVAGRVVSGLLALFWVWMGVVYHIIFFARINPAARVFGVAFVLQGLLLAHAGCVRSELALRFRPTAACITGAAFVMYAMVVYPLLGHAMGHSYPRCPAFGVAPCPATIFTFGLLLWALKHVPLYVLLVPLSWSLIGLSAAIHLNVPQDYGLGVAGVLGTALVVWKNRRMSPGSVHAVRDGG